MPGWEAFVLQTPGAGGAAAGVLFPVLGAGTEAFAPGHPLSSGSLPGLFPLGFVPAASGRARGRGSASFLRGAPVQARVAALRLQSLSSLPSRARLAIPNPYCSSRCASRDDSGVGSRALLRPVPASS